jgi:hypothetical protein
VVIPDSEVTNLDDIGKALCLGSTTDGGSKGEISMHITDDEKLCHYLTFRS